MAGVNWGGISMALQIANISFFLLVNLGEM